MDWSALTSQHVWLGNIWIICRGQIEADRARLDWVVLESAHFETGEAQKN